VSTLSRSGPSFAARQDFATVAISKLSPKAPKSKLAGSEPEAQVTLPGPALPYELTSVNAAGIAKMIVSAGPWVGTPVKQKSNWFVSTLVAAGVAITVLGGVFYAMPTMAGPTRAAAPPTSVETKAMEPAKPAEPELPSDPLSKAVEVAGVRFVTGVPGQRPEIHYLVVNHSNVGIAGVVVQVMMRNRTDDALVSQFSFRTPRLNAYESREMVSAIERMSSASTPDWRKLKAEVHIVQ
jgi:hypothetical protein